MTVGDVAKRTSSAVGNDDDEDGSAIFDETVGWYSRLRARSEKVMTDTLSSNVREALRPYRHMYVPQSGSVTVVPSIYFFSPAATLGPRSEAPRPRLPPISRLPLSSTPSYPTCLPR